MPLTRRVTRFTAGFLILFLPGCVFIGGNLNPFAATPQPLDEHVVSGEGAAKVVLVDISRLISGQDEDGAFGLRHRESTTARVREELQQAAKDDRVRAIVLRINSPGGTVTASDIVYQEIMAFKAERHVPVVAQMLDMATSGAYYIALAADEIIASPTTVTGSIGVVMVGLNIAGLMDKLGIKNQTLKAGAHKDIGSPLRPMSPEEARIMQDVLDQMQQRFLALVRLRRPGLGADAAQLISDGRILTADQALQAGLVDRTGYLDDALQAAKQRAGVSAARVVLYRRSDEFAENIYSRPALGAPQVNLLNLTVGDAAAATPQFMYLWSPGIE